VKTTIGNIAFQLMIYLVNLHFGESEEYLIAIYRDIDIDKFSIKPKIEVNI